MGETCFEKERFKTKFFNSISSAEAINNNHNETLTKSEPLVNIPELGALYREKKRGGGKKEQEKGQDSTTATTSSSMDSTPADMTYIPPPHTHTHTHTHHTASQMM